MSRFAHGRAFRLTIAQFFWLGLADLRLVLHLVSEQPCMAAMCAAKLGW